MRIHRSYGAATYPARFQLVLAANPCPCGKGSGKGLECTCTPQRRRHYQSRLSGPLLDRIDIRVEVDHAPRARDSGGETSTQVRARVSEARRRAASRLRPTPWDLNAHVPGAWYRQYTARCAPTILRELEHHLDRGRMSLRGADRILRLAWTLADLADIAVPTSTEIATATTLRTGGEYGY